MFLQHFDTPFKPITLVSLKKNEVATITTDAELSYKDTCLVTGYGLGRGVDYIELVKG